ncbi:lycopene beta-cyclase CrtY [Aureimonas psammosilenae]|uniref:lycopene beta-cyclase CrtY n=1 Tax=Aureimonas psammosilenae TaxID=2495496 RepID=UPI001F3656B7|nr:lycopene beta-cyclase CrtY [Aureimonas psammosilenae]
MPERFDLVLVGGGLANGLLAWRLAERRPDLSVLVLEAGDAPGGNHTWSFHEHDLTENEARWLAPFVAHSWPRYEVRFPARERRIETGYRSVPSTRFAELLTARVGRNIRLNSPAASLEPDAVTLDDGTRIEAGAVLDGRGHRASPHLDLGFQKFLGRELVFPDPHGLVDPVVMDATVPQADGYRFIYLLPLDPHRLLVEDTYYADGGGLDPATLRIRIDDYCTSAEWAGAETLREEQGVLPIALDGDIRRFWDARRGVPASGLAAALFHPTTGYSLPDAVRLADAISAAPDLSAPALFALCRDWSAARWEERRFFRQLNRMLFLAGEPDKRFEILQHFHRLPDDVIARFYAARLAPSDKLRILAGRPPVPVIAALRALVRPRLQSKETA